MLVLMPLAALAAPSLHLTLADAVNRAIAGNSDLALVENQAKSSVITVETARGRYQPNLKFTAEGGETFIHKPAPGEPDTTRTANLQLSTSLNLFNGFADSANLDSAELELLAAKNDLLRQRETLAYDVASRYIDILTKQELVQVAAQNLAGQQALQKQIAAFQKAGVRTLADLYQQQAATAQADSSLLSARRDLDVAKLQLLQLFGLESPIDLVLEAPDGHALAPRLQDLTAEALQDQAYARRLDLQAQQNRIDALEKQVRVAHAGALPSLDLQAATGSSYSSHQSGSIGSQLGEDNLNTSIGLVLSVPLFDRAQTRTAVAQAHSNELAAIIRRNALHQQIATDTGQALADYRLALQQLAAAQLQRRATREALKVIEERYRVGASTWVELSTARASAVQAQGDEIRSRFAVLLQGLTIGYVRGDIYNLLQHLTDQGGTS